MKFPGRRSDDDRGVGPDALEALLRAGRAAASESDLGAALDAILDAALGLVDADEGSIMLLDRSSLTLSVAAGRGLTTSQRATRVALGQGISGTVAAAGEPVLLPSVVDINRFIGHVDKEREIFASMCVPLKTRGETLGVLSVNQMRAGKTFTERALRLVSVFAETAAQTIVTARLSAEARRHAMELEILRGAMLRLGSTIELPNVAETILQEALTLASTTQAFVAVAPSGDGPPTLVRFAGLSRDGMRAILTRPGFRHLGIPSEIRIITDVPADPVFSPLGPELEGQPLALVPLRAADGRIGGLMGVVMTGSDREQAARLLSTYGTQAGLALANANLHAAVSTSAAELDTIVTSLDLPILLIDPDGYFRAINPAAASALQLSPEFEVGQDAHGKLPPEIEALVLARDGDVTADVVVTIAGEQRVMRVTTAVVHGERGEGTRIAALSDITAQNELEQKKADFLAVIGHELRTPLTSIKGFAFTLHKRGDDLPPERRADAIKSVVVQTERMERLIEDLLYVSGIEQGAPQLALGWEDANAIVAGVLEEVGRRRPDRIIRSDHVGTPEECYTDGVKVSQIVSHLLTNALEYSSEDSIVEVTIEASQHWIEIAVRDEGVGIYSGDLQRIFEPFAQVDGSATRAHGGTGVGLYICRTLADALGGRVEVESVIGRGSTFTLVVPRNTPDPQD